MGIRGVDRITWHGRTPYGQAQRRASFRLAEAGFALHSHCVHIRMPHLHRHPTLVPGETLKVIC